MKFSIVTPTFNSEAYIRETLDSVIKQTGDFSIDYIVLDNHSTDGTANIVREYQERLTSGQMVAGCSDLKLRFYSERDAGMYDAIKNGFARAQGDVHAWINSDDIYLPGAFDIVRRTLESYPDILWLKGICSYMNVHSTIFAVGECSLYRQDFIKAGLYGPVLRFIQQESVFWRAGLWKSSGGVDPKLSLAGDYFLWKAFAKITPLYSLNAYLSCFRKTPSQKSADIHAYFREIEQTSPADKRLSDKAWRYFSRIESLPKRIRKICYRLIFGAHPHHLVVLKNGIDPVLLEESDYFTLMEKT